jgi:peptide chain release factor 2
VVLWSPNHPCAHRIELNVALAGEKVAVGLDDRADLLAAEAERQQLDERLRQAFQRLEELASDPDLWSDQERAQQVTGDLSRLKAQASKVGSLRRGLDDLEVLLDLAGEESSDSALKEVEAELKKLSIQIDALEVETLLSGEFDSRGAVVTIRSGAGEED